MEAEQSIDEQIEALISEGVPDEKAESEPDHAESENEPDGLEAQAGDASDDPEEETAEEEPENEHIDYNQSIPMPDGREAMSLGALKDRVIELERTEESQISRENDLMKRSDELSNAIQASGVEITPELSQRMAVQQQAHLERESKAMFNAMPTWRDPQVFEQARKEIAEVGKTYGLTPKELSGISDHRLVKLMSDHARLLNAQKTAKDNLVRIKPKQVKKARPGRSATKTNVDKLYAQAQKSGSEADKQAAISALLG